MIILQTKIIAHGGASAAFPENTVEAFRGAAALGADWVELDVHATADGGLAVHHDAELADGRALRDLTWEELPPSIPSLAEALAACEPMGVNVEIKHAPARAVVDAIRAGTNDVIVSSFDLSIVDEVHAVEPTIATALLTFELRDPPRVVKKVSALGHVALHPHDASVDQALVDVCHDAGLLVHVWTVDDPARIVALAGMGVDGIVTNVPDVAVHALRRAR